MFTSKNLSYLTAAGMALALAAPSFAAVVALPTTLNNLTPAGATATNTSGETFSNFGYAQTWWTPILGINTDASSTIKVADAATVSPPDTFQGIAFEANGSSGELTLSNGFKIFLVGYAVTAPTAITSVDLELNAAHTGSAKYIAAVGEVVTTSHYNDPISALLSPGATTIDAYADGSASDSSTDHSIKSISGNNTTLYVWKAILLAECGSSYDHDKDCKLTDDWKSCVSGTGSSFIVSSNSDQSWTNWCGNGKPKDKSSITINSVVQSFETSGGQGSGVPEPASLAVLGLGATGLLLRRRNRR